MSTPPSRIALTVFCCTPVFAALFGFGCTPKNEPSKLASSAGAQATVVQSAEGTAAASEHPSQAPAEESLSSADLLARKTESYASSLTSIIDEQASQGAAPAPRVSDAHPEFPSPAAAAVASLDVSPQAPIANEPIAQASIDRAVAKDQPTFNVAAGAVAAEASPNAPQANVPQPDASEAAVPAAATPDSATVNFENRPAGNLEAKLAQRVKEDPLDPVTHLEYELLRFIQGEPTPDMTSLSSLPQEDQQILSALLDGLSNYRGVLKAESNPLLAQKTKPLLDMVDRLGVAADLNIPKIAVCHEVKAFGVYEPMEPARFIATKDGEYHAIIYCEIDNFSSQINDRGIWETKLRYSASLFTDTENSVEVWQGTPAEVQDHCRNRRNDFFIWDRISLPSTLTIGGYLFKVTIIDEQANRVAEATVPIQIVAR